jgi:hypothetical protein
MLHSGGFLIETIYFIKNLQICPCIYLIHNDATNFLAALLEWEKKSMVIPVLLRLNINILISAK